MRLVRLLLFLAVFAGHVWVVDPRCLFYAQNDFFWWNWPFFRDFLMAPGGLTAWAGELLLQACGAGWPGVLVLTAIAGLLCGATAAFMNRLVPRRAELAWAAPALVLLVVHGRYEYPLSVTLGATLAMGAAVGYQAIAARWRRWRLAWFTGLCFLLFYVAGAALYVFAACSLIYEFYGPAGRWTRAGLVVSVVAARCAVGGLCALFHPGVFYLHIPPSGFFAMERSLSAYAVAIYASFPLCALWLADRAARHGRNDEILQTSGSRWRLRGIGATLLFLGLAVITAHLAAQRSERTVLMLHHSAERHEWHEVLQLAQHVAPKLYSQYVIHDVNQALYHTGRMPFDMFTYPQSGCPFVADSSLDPYAILLGRQADFHFRLGRVNQAEYYAHEDLVLHPHAQSLRLLSRIAIVKGQTDVARLCLTALRAEFNHGVWAEEQLRRLDQDPAFSTDEEIAGTRSQMLVEDDIHETTTVVFSKVLAAMSTDTTKQIASLLRQRPSNRMAFEFLMAVHLVTRDVKAALQLLPQAANLGYSGPLPVYEEAAMVCVRHGWAKQDVAGPTVTVNGFPISHETLEKTSQLESMTKARKMTPNELSRLAEELGLRYFRYYYHREVGQ